MYSKLLYLTNRGWSITVYVILQNDNNIYHDFYCKFNREIDYRQSNQMVKLFHARLTKKYPTNQDTSSHQSKYLINK